MKNKTNKPKKLNREERVYAGETEQADKYSVQGVFRFAKEKKTQP